MSGQPKAKRRSFNQTVTVDVDIDAEVLEDNGYHHEDDCTAAAEPPTHDDRGALQDWHDRAHGLTLWSMCEQEPCRLLSDEFWSTP